MGVTNDFYVGKGKTIALKGRRFKEGSRFPAADLDLDDVSFAALKRDGSIVTGKERNAFMDPKPAPVPPTPQATSAAKAIRPSRAKNPRAPKFAPKDAPVPDDGLEKLDKKALLDMAVELGIEASETDSEAAVISAIRGRMGAGQ